MDTNTHRERDKEYIHVNIYVKKAPAEAKGFHGQLTPTGHSQTEILEFKRITTLSK